MVKFLNTSAVTYFLEDLIKNARDRIILISPYLKLNDRVKELLEDKNRMKIDIRIIYGKNELQPKEMAWLNNLTYVRTSFCKNLHAKCYINEDACIITSMNLYEFSQVNNNEMGIHIKRQDDADVYHDAYEEAQRIIRVSDEVRLSAEQIPNQKTGNKVQDKKEQNNDQQKKITTSKLAKQLNTKTEDIIKSLIEKGYLEIRNDKPFLTKRGEEAGGEYRRNKFGKGYFLWPNPLYNENPTSQ